MGCVCYQNAFLSVAGLLNVRNMTAGLSVAVISYSARSNW